jgi:hypothetical protein
MPFSSIPSATFDASPQRSDLTRPSTSADKSPTDKLWSAVLSTLEQITVECTFSLKYKVTGSLDDTWENNNGSGKTLLMHSDILLVCINYRHVQIFNFAD